MNKNKGAVDKCDKCEKKEAPYLVWLKMNVIVVSLLFLLNGGWFVASSTGLVTSCNIGLNSDFEEILCSLSGAVNSNYCSKIVLSSPTFGLEYILRSCVTEVNLFTFSKF